MSALFQRLLLHCPEGTRDRHPTLRSGQTLGVHHLRAAALRQHFRFLAF